MSLPSIPRTLAAGVGLSLGVHAALFAILRSRPDEPATAEDTPFLVVDVDLAPPPPEAPEPSLGLSESHRTTPATKSEPDGTTLGEVNRVDGGVASSKATDAGPIDAGSIDAQRLAVARDAAPTVSVNPAQDAGVASREVASRTDPGAQAGATPSSTAQGDPSVGADLSGYVPPGDGTVVLLRFDRLKGTPWAARADAIVAPMPDYRSIIGDRKIALADRFDTLLISSSDPTDVVATNLFAHSSMTGAEARKFLDHAKQRVTWTTARGGALGTRKRSAFTAARDDRQYLLPFPGWIVLTRPANYGSLADASEGSIDKARALDADLPDWLSKVRNVADEAGRDAGPVAVVSVGSLPTRLRLPQIGDLPGPLRASVALEVASVGFDVRGSLTFRTDADAKTFENTITASRDDFLDSTLKKAFLKNFHLFNAVQGLSLKRRATVLTFATSISGADAKAMMDLAADATSRFYSTQREESGK